ncbi:unnamed protein product [Rhodiola kirilowii]
MTKIFMQKTVLMYFIFNNLIAFSFGGLQRFEHPAKSDGSLSFLVIGDWGRRGLYNQSEIANQMGIVGEKLNIDFVVSTGDNFYDDGLIGVNDTNFEESFTNVYTARSLQKPWFTILGNHDYRGNVEAQLSHALRKIDGRWVCLRSYLLNSEIAEFFFVDTTPFIDMYVYDPKDHKYDWRGLFHRKRYIKGLVKDLESVLKESTANWKIVVGHHAIRSIGHHGDTEELVKWLLPILQAYDVDFYMNGHDHCLEHISSLDGKIQFFTSGAGSKAWRGDVKTTNPNNGEVKFFHDGQGFMSVLLTPLDAEVAFYDVFGKIGHTWKITKQLHSVM